jgi:hypothetical protein
MATEMAGETRNGIEPVPDRPGGAVTRRALRLRRRQVGYAAPLPFATAGDLLRLLGSVPADTPVRVAETVRVAAGLDLRRTSAETVTAVTRPRPGDGEPFPGTEIGMAAGREKGSGTRTETGLEIGAYVVARGAGPPAHAVPFPAYESAVEALQRGDTQTALEAQVELLEWIAGTLSTGDPDPDRPSGATASVADPVLREQLDIESRRIREAARRLEAVRARVSAVAPDPPPHRRERRAHVRDDAS